MENVRIKEDNDIVVSAKIKDVYKRQLLDRVKTLRCLFYMQRYHVRNALRVHFDALLDRVKTMRCLFCMQRYSVR